MGSLSSPERAQNAAVLERTHGSPSLHAPHALCLPHWGPYKPSTLCTQNCIHPNTSKPEQHTLTHAPTPTLAGGGGSGRACSAARAVPRARHPRHAGGLTGGAGSEAAEGAHAPRGGGDCAVSGDGDQAQVVATHLSLAHVWQWRGRCCGVLSLKRTSGHSKVLSGSARWCSWSQGYWEEMGHGVSAGDGAALLQACTAALPTRPTSESACLGSILHMLDILNRYVTPAPFPFPLSLPAEGACKQSPAPLFPLLR